MEDLKIGQFIRDRRIELGMTQQQLADKLGITDKAVSKWERCVSYPDITILRDLSAALGVSVNELLAGERDLSSTPAVPPEVQETVVDTVAYAETARRRNSGWRFWTFVVLTIGCAIAALVMFILHLTLGDSRRTFLRVIQIIAISWAICYPLLRTDNHPIRNTLIIASIAVYPLVLTNCYPYWYVWHLGVITISVAYVWAIYWLWYQRMGWLKTVISVGSLGVVLHIGIATLIGVYDGIPMVLIVCAILAMDALCLWGPRIVERAMARRADSLEG